MKIERWQPLKTTLIICVLSIVTTLCCTSRLLAEATYNGIKYFDISGLTMLELMDSIARQEMPKPDAVGYTEFQSNSEWTSLESADGTCRLSDFQFSYSITIHMPRWINKDGARLCLQRNWNTAWQQILLHEKEHLRLFQLLEPHVIAEKVNQLPAQKSCSVLKTKIENSVDRMVQANRKLHDAFHAVDPPTILQDC